MTSLPAIRLDVAEQLCRTIEDCGLDTTTLRQRIERYQQAPTAQKYRLIATELVRLGKQASAATKKLAKWQWPVERLPWWVGPDPDRKPLSEAFNDAHFRSHEVALQGPGYVFRYYLARLDAQRALGLVPPS